MANYVKLSDSEYDLEVTGRQVSSEEVPLKAEQVLFNPDEKLTLVQAVRKWPRLTLYCLGLTSTIILAGYDAALVGNVAGMPEFKKVYGTVADGQEIIPSHWLALWNISSNIGGMIGALLGGWLGDRIGRRWMLFGSSVFVGASVTLFLLSDLPPTRDGKSGLFFFAKVIQGIAVGAQTSTTQTWMSEAVPDALKASVLATFPIFTLLGQIIGSVVIQVQLGVEGRGGYRVGLASQFAFAVPPLIMSWLLPESPSWLLRKGRDFAARAAFDKLLKGKKHANTNVAFTKLHETIMLERRHAKADQITYMQCFSGTDTRRTLIVIFAACVPELFGLHLVGNATYFLQTIGITANLANIIFIAGVGVCLVSIISSFWTLTIFRRRQLFISTLSIITGIWLFIGIVGTTGQQKVIQWSICVAFVLLTMTAGFGVWPASYVVGGETSSLRLRSRSQGIGWTASGAWSCVIGIVMPYVYNPDAGNLGALSGFVYVGLSGIATVISFFFLPEMKGRSAAELDEMFARELPARQFKHWSKH